MPYVHIIFLTFPDNNINYAPKEMFYIASNLEEDKEYSFEVCAVTQRGRGEVAPLTVRTLRQGMKSLLKKALSLFCLALFLHN